MSTPSFQTGRRKIAPPFGGFTPAWGGEFSKSLFFVYAAQFLRWGSPLDTEEKKRFLHQNHIALWDVIGSCDITGSSDSSIKNVCANDLSDILNGSHISRIFVNGKAAEKYYNRYTRSATGMDAFCLPSTSPANAAWSLEKLIGAWSVIKGF